MAIFVKINHTYFSKDFEFQIYCTCSDTFICACSLLQFKFTLVASASDKTEES